MAIRAQKPPYSQDSLIQGGNDILRDFSPPGIDKQVPPNLIPKIENEAAIPNSHQLTKTPSRTIKRRASSYFFRSK